MDRILYTEESTTTRWVRELQLERMEKRCAEIVKKTEAGARDSDAATEAGERQQLVDRAAQVFGRSFFEMSAAMKTTGEKEAKGVKEARERKKDALWDSTMMDGRDQTKMSALAGASPKEKTNFATRARNEVEEHQDGSIIKNI